MRVTARGCAGAAWLSAVWLLPVNLWTAPAWAQGQGAPKLEIVIVEGDGAINNIKERTVREPVIEVDDENHKPIAGAAVVFFLPNQGPGGTFFDGTKSLTITTDAQGRAVARGIKFNNLSGQMQIRVTASSSGQTATAVITQTNVAGAAASGTGLSTTAKVLIVVGIAAGAAVGAVLATRGGSSSSSSGTPSAPSITITAGTPTVGAP
jgi:hypothetical protein